MSWEERAACAACDPEIFFAVGQRDERKAKRVCGACPVRLQCLASALREPIEHGIWGGLNERERRRLRRRYPRTRDWGSLISEVGLPRLLARGA